MTLLSYGKGHIWTACRNEAFYFIIVKSSIKHYIIEFYWLPSFSNFQLTDVTLHICAIFIIIMYNHTQSTKNFNNQHKECATNNVQLRYVCVVTLWQLY
jgi:hypothetical protein